jgi:hypothetical protein
MSVLVEIKRDNRKIQNVKRTRLFKKYNIEKEENLNRLIEELKQKVAAKTTIQIQENTKSVLPK